MGKRNTVVVTMAAGLMATAALLFGTSATAERASGGGPTKSDCYIEADFDGVPASGIGNGKKVTCKDGAACDVGTTDKSCTFHVRLCKGATNSSCTKPASLDSITVKKATIPTPDLAADSTCGAFVDIEVPLKKGGKKPGKANFKVIAKASKGTKPRTDVDAYQIICISSPSGAFVD